MFRHRGTSFDAYHGAPIHDVQNRGQWKRETSCMRYMKHGRYLRRLASLPVAAMQTARSIEATLKLRLVQAIRGASWPPTFFALSKPDKMLSLAAFAVAEDDD